LFFTFCKLDADLFSHSACHLVFMLQYKLLLHYIKLWIFNVA